MVLDSGACACYYGQRLVIVRFPCLTGHGMCRYFVCITGLSLLYEKYMVSFDFAFVGLKISDCLTDGWYPVSCAL